MHRMEEASNFGVMAATTMENIWLARNMALEFIIGQMGQSTRVNGSRTRCMEAESLFGPMDASIEEPL